MKVRLGYFLAGMAVASLIWFVSSHHLCGTKPAPEVSEAMNIHKAAYTWALDHGGEMPPDLAFLKSGNYVHPPISDRTLAGVVEYCGKGMRISDDGKLLFLRYRAGQDKEVRGQSWRERHGRADPKASSTVIGLTSRIPVKIQGTERATR